MVVEDEDVAAQPPDDERGEEPQVAPFHHPALQGLELALEREVFHQVGGAAGERPGKPFQHRGRPGVVQRPAGDDPEDEGDDLVAGEGGEKAPGGEERPGEEQRREVAANDGPAVGGAQPIDREHHREGQGEGEGEDRPRREELAEDRLGGGHRQGEEQFQRVAFALFRPQAHGDGGDEQQEQEGHLLEEEVQRRLPDEEEVVAKGEKTREGEEDDEENVGQRGGKVAFDLAAVNAESAGHRRSPSIIWLPAALGDACSSIMVYHGGFATPRPQATEGGGRDPPTSRKHVSCTMSHAKTAIPQGRGGAEHPHRMTPPPEIQPHSEPFRGLRFCMPGRRDGHGRGGFLGVRPRQDGPISVVSRGKRALREKDCVGWCRNIKSAMSWKGDIMQLSFAARAVMNPAMMLAGQRQAGEVEFGGLVDMGVNLVGGHSWHGGSLPEEVVNVLA